MHLRITRTGTGVVLAFLSFSAAADTKWLPSPAILPERSITGADFWELSTARRILEESSNRNRCLPS